MKLSPQEIQDLSFIQDDPVQTITEVASNQKTSQEAYPTGLKSLDFALGGGFQDGNLVIISGISGEGKTSLMESLTKNFITKGIPCLWFTYEIPVKVLHWRFKRMGLEDNYEAYTPKVNTSGNLLWVEQKIQEAWMKYACKVVFIDMLDFLSPREINTKDNEALSLKKIAQELKNLAIKTETIIIVTTHITKMKEGEEPGMQNIAWSGGIYQNADFVLMINRERIKQSRRTITEPVTELCTEYSFVKLVKNRATGELKRIKCLYKNNVFQEVDYDHVEPSTRPVYNDHPSY